jgi:hypothetical protein
MACQPTAPITETAFAHLLRANRAGQSCAGPMTMVRLAPWRLDIIDDALTVPSPLGDLLWDNVRPEQPGYLAFELCLLHWFDIAGALTRIAVGTGRVAWIDHTRQLIDDLLVASGVDGKEIANGMRSGVAC